MIVIAVQQNSKTQCCCSRVKSLFLRTNLQVLVVVLVLGPQVLVLVFES